MKRLRKGPLVVFLAFVTKAENPLPQGTTAVEVCSLFADCHQQVAVFKWIESQKAGFDIGEERAIHTWVREHWSGYLRSKLLEHLLGYKYWSELDKGDFGILKNSFQDQSILLDRIIDRLKVNQENLDIILWAQDFGICPENVIRILEALDINSRRISPRFDS
jgi:hypothetical protein